ncbi:MAG: ABC transporter permease [Lachnobacterium sp.]|nr:ABC transporter permease [Lachnobacterium sp.]
MTNFKYALLRLMRNKANLFWILVFPIVLGCFFKIAFSNITASESFHTIPVAVVEGDNADATAFHTMIEQLSGDSEDAMLSATFCDDKKARTLLEKGKVDGIFYTTDTVELAVNSDLSDASINQSILQSLLTQYYLNRDLIVQILTTNPGNIESLVDSIGQSVDTRKEVSLTRNNTDTYDQYFYNLIAMACLYTAMGGINLAINNSANLSSLAARKTIAPAKRAALIGTELLAIILFESLLNMVSFLFIVTVLGVHMTTHLGLALLTILISTTFSITFGMFLGCVGPKSEGGKTGLMFAVVMPLCFLSGLMMGTMRMVVEKYAPFVNRINPAALISDSFYALNNYDTLTRYTGNILTLLLMTVLFLIISILVTRRKTYASL